MFNNLFNNGIYIANPRVIKNFDIVKMPIPKKVILLLQQRVGGKAHTCVKVGDNVLTGQVIARSVSRYRMPVHSSISGVVSAIDNQPIAHPSGIDGMCITIESDGKDKWVEKEEHGDDFLKYTPQDISEKIRKAGIVGMGGAGFPTHAKIDKVNNIKHTKYLIINATECEPGIMCDDALMQAYPQEVIRGVEILMHACGVENATIAIEDDKQEAFVLLEQNNHNKHIKIQKIPTKYASGTEKLLIKNILGIEINSGSFAFEAGVLCQNIGTVKAIYDAIVRGIPLISRVVTVTGSGVLEPRNYEVRLGSSFVDIVSKFELSKKQHDIRMGGMMMGVDVPNTGYSVCKITNCIFVNNKIKKPIAQECIRCSDCNKACPVGLLPQQLYWYAKNKDVDKAFAYNLADCISCGYCDYVCPSNIILTKYFSFARALNRQQITQNSKTDIARQRFEYREYRLQRNKKEHAIMMEAKKKSLKQKLANQALQKAKIAAAMDRVNKAKQ